MSDKIFTTHLCFNHNPKYEDLPRIEVSYDLFYSKINGYGEKRENWNCLVECPVCHTVYTFRQLFNGFNVALRKALNV